MTYTEDTLFQELLSAYHDARLHKRWTEAHTGFFMNLEGNLYELTSDLMQRRYHPGSAICFIVHEPVKREVFASSFRDRVVQHLLYNFIYPVFERRFIYDSYSCRLGKGTMLGVQRCRHHIVSCTRNYTRDAYIGKFDIKGYFMSIDKEILYRIVKEDLEKSLDNTDDMGVAWRERLDLDLIDYLLKTIIFRDVRKGCIKQGHASEWDGLPPSKSLFYSPDGCGLPIGDLTSQLFSNIYMNRFDEYVKKTLHCKHYGRYVDDFFIVDESKEHLKSLVPLMENYLKSELHLTLHPLKRTIVKSIYGITFLGAEIRPFRNYCCNRTVKKYRKVSSEYLNKVEQGEEPFPGELKCLPNDLISYVGYLRHFKSEMILQPLKRVCMI